MEFKTKDMFLSASLIHDGVKFLRMENDPTDLHKKVFIFDESDEIERVKAERANGTLVVNALSYEDALRRIKTLIHS